MKKLVSYILGFATVILVMSSGHESSKVYSDSFAPDTTAVVNTS